MSSNRPQNGRPNVQYVQAAGSDDDGGLGAGSMIAMAVVFLGSFVAAFYLWGGNTSGPVATVASKPPPRPAAFVSSVDAKCGKTWEADQPNIDELNCYMTTDRSRLCDPREREHFMATLARFEKDHAVYMARFNVAAMQTAVSGYTQSMQMGWEHARMEQAMNDPNATEEERKERSEKFFKRMTGVMAPVSEVQSRRKQTTLALYQIEPRLTDLVTDGYLSAKDFKGAQPRWVRSALGAVRSVNRSCG